MQTKRKIILNNYDTAVDGLWTLAACVLSDAEPITNYIDVPGRLDGPIDASTALTGDIRYKPRVLNTMLESSEGTRQERESRIDQMVHELHGQRAVIWLPDDEAHYLLGRVSIKKEYNDLAHAAVAVSAVCEPWRYENVETEYKVTVSGDTKEVTLENARRPALPLLTVEGSVRLEFKGNSYALGEGTHKLPSLLITQYGQTVKVSGDGSVTFLYRKAVL